MINKLIGPKGLVLFSIIIVLVWFRHGLLFAGAEEELSFYNFTKSLELFSYPWYPLATGNQTLLSLPRLPYFIIFEFLYRLGFSNVFLQALTFFIIILSGILSVYYLLRETLEDIVKPEWAKLSPFIGALFYFLNPFAMTQIWGRALAYQFFSFALIPSFLLFFVLSIKKRNLIYLVPGVLLSIFFSGAYLSPAVVVASWATIGIYLLSYIAVNRNIIRNISFSLLAFGMLLVLWIIAHFFWILPFLKHGGETVNLSLSWSDSVASLKGLAANSRIYNVVRLIHREYYDGTYGPFYQGFLVVLISWLLPVFALFSYSTLKKSRHFLFYFSLLLIGIIVSIGANFPTGAIFVWFFEKIPLLAVLRNPYEKFGINLVLAYAPFAALGMLLLSEKLSARKAWLRNFLLACLIFLQFIVLVWPYWKGNFAGGERTNFWVEVPGYYKQANDWLNRQAGDFNILHLPLLPEDGITYTWKNFYEGMEPSIFLFDRPSVARNFSFNKEYYSALLDKFGASFDFTKLLNYSRENKDFKDPDLTVELSKLNTRYIVLHNDTDYKFRRAVAPDDVRKFLESQNIGKVEEFGKLEIYKVNIPENISLLYSPDAKVRYKKINNTEYIVDVESNSETMNLNFLQMYHPDWQASIDGEIITAHKKIFSYANSWEINKKGNFQVNLKFIQQYSVDFGKKVSLASISIMAAVMVFSLIKRGKLFN